MRRLFVSALLGAAVCCAQDTVSAKLDAEITPTGALQASVIVLANGTRAATYRNAFQTGGAGIGSPALFGSFLHSRKLQSSPVLTDVSAPVPGVQIRIPILEEDFLLPIEHRKSFQLDLLPLRSPDQSPAKFREEIRFAIPADFAGPAEFHLTEDREFARYRSDATIDSRTLIVVRELQLKQETLGGSSKAELESFFQIVIRDQQRRFMLRRTGNTKLTEWIKSVPPSQANKYGERALELREYETARQLFERAVEATPDHSTAWNNLGRALAALGKFDEAQKAYEKQLSVNPKHPTVYDGLAQLQDRQGHWDLAVPYLKKQLEIHPNDAIATFNLPPVLLRVGRWAEAEKAASQAIKERPDNASTRLNLTLARVCGGSAAEPRKEIETALGKSANPMLVNKAAYYLGECDKDNDLTLSLMKEVIDAAKLTEMRVTEMPMLDAVRAQSALAMYIDTYGWLLFKQGKVEQALDLLNAAVALTARAELYAHLAQVESKLGHTDKASADWREATLLEPGQLSQVPASIASRLDSVTPPSVDRVWFPIQPGLLDRVAVKLPTDQPSYFFLRANPDGSVRSAQELDSDDPVAKSFLPALSNLTITAVTIDGSPLPTVYFAKLVKGADGKVLVARSLGTEAGDIAAELAPNDFYPGDSASGPFKIGGTVSAPSLLHRDAPEYSEEARLANLQGTVVLYVVVGADGKPRDLKVIRSLGLGLDEKAISAVSGWAFRPGQKSGEPVNVQASIDVNFRIFNAKGGSYLTRAEFRTPPGATRPFLGKSAYPPPAIDPSKATMTLTFDVDEHGDAANIHVEKTSDEAWANEMIAALRQWKFIPGSKDAIPLAVSCTMDFARGN
jgi:TonB family protein